MMRLARLLPCLVAVLGTIGVIPGASAGAPPDADPAGTSQQRNPEDRDNAPAQAARAGMTAGSLRVPLGKSRLLEYRDVTHVAVGDGSLVKTEVVEESGHVLIIGEETGETDLRIWSDNEPVARYDVQVVRQRGTRTVTAAEIRELLGRGGDLEIKKVGNSFNVTGRAGSVRQYKRLQSLTNRFQRLYSYANRPAVEPRESVYIKAQFLEVSTNALEDIGIDFEDQISGPVFATANDFEANDVFRPEFDEIDGSQNFPLDIGTGNNFFGLGFELTSMINLLVEDGYARVLAEPTLSARSGETASFNSGGEVPIPIQTAEGGAEVQFKTFGIQLEVAPVVSTDAETIRSEVRVEVSDVDESLSVQGIPGFTEQRAETVMSAPPARSLVIAGLVDEDESKAVQKVPGLGEIPLLGELFKSRDFQSDRTELVVVVTPYIGGTDSRINEALKRRHGRMSESGKRNTEFQLLD